MSDFYKIHNHRFHIDYPQVKLPNELYKYKCAYCGMDTVTIAGKLSNHLPTCEYRIEKQKK